MKPLIRIDLTRHTNPYIVWISRIAAAILIGAGSLYYWKSGVATTDEGRMTSFLLGTLPIIYGSLIALMSLKPDIEKRIKFLNNMVGLPLIMALASIVIGLILTALK